MQKNFTHFSNGSFIPHDEKDLKETPSSPSRSAMAQQGQEVPSDETIQNILNFSKSLEMKKSISVGLIEVVLN